MLLLLLLNRRRSVRAVRAVPADGTTRLLLRLRLRLRVVRRVARRLLRCAADGDVTSCGCGRGGRAGKGVRLRRGRAVAQGGDRLERLAQEGRDRVALLLLLLLLSVLLLRGRRRAVPLLLRRRARRARDRLPLVLRGLQRRVRQRLDLCTAARSRPRRRVARQRVKAEVRAPRFARARRRGGRGGCGGRGGELLGLALERGGALGLLADAGLLGLLEGGGERQRPDGERGGRAGFGRELRGERCRRGEESVNRGASSEKRKHGRTLLDAEDVANERVQRQALEPLLLDLVRVLRLLVSFLARTFVLTLSGRPLLRTRRDIERRLGRRDLGVAVGAEPGQDRVDDRGLDGRDSAQLVPALVASFADDEL